MTPSNVEQLYQEAKDWHKVQIERLSLIDSRVREISVFSLAVLTGVGTIIFHFKEELSGFCNPLLKTLIFFTGLTIFLYLIALFLCLFSQSKNKLIRNTNIDGWLKPGSQPGDYNLDPTREKWDPGKTQKWLLYNLYDACRKNELFISEKGKFQEYALTACIIATSVLFITGLICFIAIIS